MKKFLLLLCMGSLLFACNSEKTKDDTKVDTEKKTEETSTADTKPMPDSATMMKNWQDYATPSEMHKMMAAWDGNWEGEVTMWMPGSPEQKSKSTTVNKMIFNGLYQESTHSGNMMGAPFNGKSTLGYDNHRKEFVSTWIDNMGSGIMVMKGTWDEATKTMNLKGTVVDPGTKEDCNVRETFKIVDANTQEMEMFGPDPTTGKEMKTMQIIFRRKG